MPNDTDEILHEVLIVPLPALLSQTAQAVAQAQTALDEMSMRVQQQLSLLTAEALAVAGDEPAGLARFQVDAAWYHIPEVEIELKMALSLEVRERVSNGGKAIFLPTLLSMPHNARSQNLTNFQADGASRITARLVSIPPSERAA